MTQLDTAWVSDLRDKFIEEGNYKISQGVMWKHQDVDNLWHQYTVEEMSQLAAEFLDANDFERPGSKNWISVINNQNHRKELVSGLWTYRPLWDKAFFASAPPGLAVGNSFIVVTADGMGAVPLTAEHRARHSLGFQLPKDLDSMPEPTAYIGALKRVFGEDGDGERKLMAFQEFLGACRTGIVTSYERCIIMPGGGSNGKSTILMGGAESLFSKHETRSIIPNFLNQEYYLMQMRDAAINVVTELPKERINCTERFKQIISGEDVTGRPIREMPVTFRPTAGHIYACNNFPQLSDNSKGMWRRLLVLRADATFGKGDGLRADIVDKFRAEAPQILVWALRGAQRLMKQGDYTFPQSHTDEAKIWQGTNDKSLQFVNNCTNGIGNGWSKGAEVHKRYLSWYRGMGYPWNDAMDPGAFGSALKHLDGFVSKRQSYGMAYNFVVKPKSEWFDYSESEGGGMEVSLEEEKSNEKS